MQINLKCPDYIDLFFLKRFNFKTKLENEIFLANK